MNDELRAQLQLACLVGPQRAREHFQGTLIRPDERDGTLAGFRFFASQLWHPPEAWPNGLRPYKQYHWDWAALCIRERECGVVAPRGHGKTSRIGAPIVAWWTIHHPDEAWLITSYSPSLARATVTDIADRLQREWWAPGRPGPGYVYPGLVSKALTGHPAEICYSTRAAGRTDPNIRGAGILGEGITGFHYDGVLADDVVGTETARTAGAMERLERFWGQKLMPTLTGKKRLWRMFTLYSPQDLNARAIDRGLPICDEHRSAVIGDLQDDDCQVLDENYHDLESLRAIRAEIGAVDFALQFQNDTSAAEGAFFRREWLECAADGTEPAQLERVVLTGDLAYSGGAGSDYTALVVAGRDRRGTYHLLDLVRHRYDSISQTADAIQRLHRAWKPHVVATEAGPGAMNQLHHQLDRLLRDRGISGLKRLRAAGNKEQRAAGLQARLETGVWKIPVAGTGVYAALRGELLSFPRGEHDDMVDALAYADIELTGPRLSNRAPQVAFTSPRGF
jgi:predicted phage terminase large subunit-like protein